MPSYDEERDAHAPMEPCELPDDIQDSHGMVTGGLVKRVSHGMVHAYYDNLAASLARFIGSTAYGPGSLREDFARFRFLLSVTDGEGLFTPDVQ